MKTIYFISPHLDDAFFSAGALMLKLLAKKQNMVVVNVFTSAGNLPQTFSAKTFLKQVGEKSGQSLYQKRIQEDAAVFKKLGVKVINLNLVEALWRKKIDPSLLEKTVGKILPEAVHTYPIYRLNIINGMLSNKDNHEIQAIATKLKSLVASTDIIVCPVGIGGHIDHLIVRAACEKLSNPVIYWADIPYVDRAKSAASLVSKELTKEELKVSAAIQKQKDVIAQMYTTQYAPVFGTKGTLHIHEIYFSTQENLNAVLKNL